MNTGALALGILPEKGVRNLFLPTKMDEAKLQMHLGAKEAQDKD
jgi:hypothetical protein